MSEPLDLVTVCKALGDPTRVQLAAGAPLRLQEIQAAIAELPQVMAKAV